MSENKSKNVPMERKETHPTAQAELTHDLPVFAPATDIYENDEAILVMCDLPGVAEKDVDVSLEDDVLTITGRQSDQTPDKHQLLYRGYNTGVYRRAFTLTADVDREKIKAALANGVLSITLPKAEAAKPRKITVEAA